MRAVNQIISYDLPLVMAALVPVLLAHFTRHTFGPGAGRFAGWIAAVNPLMVFFSGYLLTETTFSFFLLLALFVAWGRFGAYAF